MLLQRGFVRILVNNEMVRLDKLPDSLGKKEIFLIIDRIVFNPETAPRPEFFFVWIY